MSEVFSENEIADNSADMPVAGLSIDESSTSEVQFEISRHQCDNSGVLSYQSSETERDFVLF